MNINKIYNMNEIVKNFLVSDKNSTYTLGLFLVISCLLLIEGLLQFLGYGFFATTAGLVIVKILGWVSAGLLFLIPVAFVSLLLGVIFGNRDIRHILLLSILGVMLATTIVGVVFANMQPAVPALGNY